MLVINNMW